ncbi:MAG: hypothetical protein JO275_07030 [Verrucomicrobia bacterium]|nr:hypothetical protein [Verrucomicrobiota bacterium]
MATKIALRVLAIGLFAGTLDIADALIFNVLRGITPVMVLQYIASGLIGAASFHGGLATSGLGLVLHYLIALGWTTLFYIASRKIATLTRRPILSGLIYGDVIYLVMNFVILPFSSAPHPKSTTTIAALVNGVLALMFCIGLPISVLTARYLPARDRG